MNKQTVRFFLAGAALGLLIAFASCSSSSNTCDASNCTGCCDAGGTCHDGNASDACGHGAIACTTCTAGQSCMAGTCGNASGGGAGGGSGGGTGGGSGGGTGGGSGGGTGGGTGGGSGGGTGGGSGGGGGGAGGGCGGAGGIDAGTVNVTFAASCPTFTPCGGNLDGAWKYSSACIPDSDFDTVKNGLEQYCGAGTVTLSNKQGSFSGTVIFACNVATRHATGSIGVTATATGTTCGNSIGCGVINSGLSTYGFSGTCSVSGSNCVCDITTPVAIDDSGPYTVAGSTLTLTNSGRTYDYCVTGNSLTTRETTSGSNTKDPGYPTLTR